MCGVGWGGYVRASSLLGGCVGVCKATFRVPPHPPPPRHSPTKKVRSYRNTNMKPLTHATFLRLYVLRVRENSVGAWGARVVVAQVLCVSMARQSSARPVAPLRYTHPLPHHTCALFFLPRT